MLKSVCLCTHTHTDARKYSALSWLMVRPCGPYHVWNKDVHAHFSSSMSGGFMGCTVMQGLIWLLALNVPEFLCLSQETESLWTLTCSQLCGLYSISPIWRLNVSISVCGVIVLWLLHSDSMVWKACVRVYDWFIVCVYVFVCACGCTQVYVGVCMSVNEWPRSIKCF